MNAQKICIIGDGLAGLSAAAILSQENIKIDLYSENIRKNKLKRDNRTTAISESNFQFIKQKLDIKKNNIFWACKEINLFYEKKNTIKNFLNFKEKKKILMYIFKNYQLKKILSEAIVKKKNIEVIKKKITNIDFEKGSILLNKKSFFYDLIILSIGGNSYFYDSITQGRSIKKNYNEVGLTTNIKHNSKINTVSQFFLKEGPLAILPFGKNMFSVVWSVSNSFFYKNKASIKKILSTKIKLLLKNPEIKNLENIQSFPINLNLKTKYFKKNVLILGDGLHTVHPMAGQGFNLVLRDIKKLSELISKILKIGIAFNNSFLLKDFYQNRKIENTIVGLGIDLTNFFFKENKYLYPIKNKILENIKKFGFVKRVSQRIADKGILI
jgi:2-polyprenyl-6-methoxyphenol hydroxylase-like FAD-dependent oxidoreductase